MTLIIIEMKDRNSIFFFLSHTLDQIPGYIKIVIVMYGVSNGPNACKDYRYLKVLCKKSSC